MRSRMVRTPSGSAVVMDRWLSNSNSMPPLTGGQSEGEGAGRTRPRGSPELQLHSHCCFEETKMMSTRPSRKASHKTEPTTLRDRVIRGIGVMAYGWADKEHAMIRCIRRITIRRTTSQGLVCLGGTSEGVIPTAKAAQLFFSRLPLVESLFKYGSVWYSPFLCLTRIIPFRTLRLFRRLMATPAPEPSLKQWPQVPRHIARRPESHVDLHYGGGKLILAPMVRCGTLPMRMLALEEGADIVYSPETIDRRLARSKRVENVVANCIDFVDIDDGSVNLRVHAKEKSRLVVQIGSSDPENAVKAALVVAGDCSGIDLNCGCPKKFSIVSAMGAALLSHPDRLCEILTALVESVPLPITAKIRMLESREDTIALVQRIERTGVSAIGLHCRLRSERPTDPGHWDVFEPVAQAIKIPLIANGDLYSREDVERLKRIAPSVASFMMARAPESNFSVFNPRVLKTPSEAIIAYAKAAVTYDMVFHNAKYVLMQMWPASQKKRNRRNKRGKPQNVGASVDADGSDADEDERPDIFLPPIGSLAKSKSYKDLSEFIPGLREILDQCEAERKERSLALDRADLLMKDVEAELGPDCPYLPREVVMHKVKRNSRGQVVGEGDDKTIDAETDEGTVERKKHKDETE